MVVGAALMPAKYEVQCHVPTVCVGRKAGYKMELQKSCPLPFLPSHAKIRDFLGSLTGMPYCHPFQRINMVFTTGQEAFIFFSTCGNQLSISEHITSEQASLLCWAEGCHQGENFTVE